jgi:membrane associated rhomboid family serine protease
VAAEVMTCYRHPDRETGVSCSECGRGICPDCMVFAPVGIRCLDHASQGRGPARPAMRRSARSVRAGFLSQEGSITRILIGMNVAVFLVNLLQGSSLSRTSGSLFNDWALIARGVIDENGDLVGVRVPPGVDVSGIDFVGVAEGQWWRLLTAAFLHGSIIHLGLNMLFLWFIGTPMEIAVGRWRYIALYVVTALSGSAGAILLDPSAPTVGASGALFGILGAAVVFEQQGMHVLGGSALGIAVINFLITLAVPGISLGGHAGGFVGGVVCGLALSRFGRGHAAYGRLGLVGVGAIVGVGIASVLVAYFKVRGYT